MLQQNEQIQKQKHTHRRWKKYGAKIANVTSLQCCHRTVTTEHEDQVFIKSCTVSTFALTLDKWSWWLYFIVVMVMDFHKIKLQRHLLHVCEVKLFVIKMAALAVSCCNAIARSILSIPRWSSEEKITANDCIYNSYGM